ncbi:KCMA1 [Fasciola hepatica]|uniref:BK channel n=1 Tax=Fasciola hepatica TaxID=6192 RepID=A0A4E0R212_FASHE|nr:KCMA1 [Fasciola hepatica]
MGQTPGHLNHTHVPGVPHNHEEPCMATRFWPVFVSSSLLCFFGGILVILLYRVVVQLISRLFTCGHPTRLAVDAGGTPDPLASRDRSARTSGVPTSRWTRSQSLNSINMTPNPMDEMELRAQGSIVSTSHSVFGPSFPPTGVGYRLKSGCHALVQGVHLYAVQLVSYQWLAGRAFIALSMIMSLCSFGIYVYEATFFPSDIEKCGHKGRRMRAMDFAMNIFFFIHFVVRFIACRDALLFWIDWYSILDYFTVPPTLFGFFIKRSWLGFRFLRVFRLTNLGEVLHNLKVVRSASSLRMCQLCTYFLSIWLSGAGMILLLENTGNLIGSDAYQVSNPIAYPTALYFTIVTMSTVGYGDITPVTFLGKCFVCLFILFALATFASAIPEIADMFFTSRKYSGSYTKPEGKSHIVVCGDITTDSVKTFLSDFLHEDRQRTDVEVVFINPCKPDLQLQSILRLHFSRVKYFQGTVMDHGDLQRVRMVEADACLILASSTASDSHQKDAANIMRVIAVKNYASHVRVIVQLLHTENKAHLLNSPYWNWDQGDEIICFSELKLGFLAQSCVAPGFSTLVTNLFSMCSQQGIRKLGKRAHVAGRKLSRNELMPSPRRDPSKSSTDTSRKSLNQIAREKGWRTGLRFLRNIFQKREERDLLERERNIPAVRVTTSSVGTVDALCRSELQSSVPSLNRLSSLLQADECWLVNYLRGVSMEIYSAPFSDSFEGLSFADAAVICRQRLDLLLIAVVARNSTRATAGALDTTSEQVRADNPTAYLEPDRLVKTEDETALKSEEDEGLDRSETGYYLAINPAKEANVCIDPNTVGFFICDSQSNASRVTYFCSNCHGTESQDPTTVIPCSCSTKTRRARNRLKRNTRRLFGRSQNSTLLVPSLDGWEATVHLPTQTEEVENCVQSDVAEETVIQPKTISSQEATPQRWDIQEPQISVEGVTQNQTELNESTLDVTGMYHYCETRSFESSLLLGSKKSMTTQQRNRMLINHILLCLLTKDGQPLMGLHSFVMPLRASHFHTDELKTIVILGDRSYLAREWPSIANFPHVFCLPGSPLSRADLRTARIRFASVCVILGSRGEDETGDPYMLDKEAILCSLNIRGMRFPPVTSKTLQSKAPIRRLGSEIPMITELVTDANIHYLDPEDVDTGACDIPAALTAAFARGVAFTTSVLDVLASTAYFDCNSMTLIRHLITGGVTPALEQWLAEGGGLNCCDRYDDEPTTGQNEGEFNRYRSRSNCHLLRSSRDSSIQETRQRPRIGQLSVLDSRLRPLVSTDNYIFPTFGALFCHAIQERGILCLAIYRSAHIDSGDEGQKMIKLNSLNEQLLTERNRLKPNKPWKERRLSTCAQSFDRMIRTYSLRLQREVSLCQSNVPTSRPTRQGTFAQTLDVVNRYVITNPPNDFPLKQSDLVFCLRPFEQRKNAEV